MALGAEAIAGGIATVIGGGLNFWSQERANEQNKMLMREQMAFQREMSNTAHQRQVEDLRRAGLNPILSANSGASAPSGSSAQMGAVNFGDLGASAKQVAMLSEELKQLQNSNKKLEADTGLSNANKTVAVESAKKVAEETKNVKTQREATQLGNDMLRASLPKAKLEGQFYSSPEGILKFYVDQALGTISQGASSAGEILRKGLPKPPQPTLPSPKNAPKTLKRIP